MHFLGFRFAPPQAIIRARLRRLRASVLGHDQKRVNGLGEPSQNLLIFAPFGPCPCLVSCLAIDKKDARKLSSSLSTVCMARANTHRAAPGASYNGRVFGHWKGYVSIWICALLLPAQLGPSGQGYNVSIRVDPKAEPANGVAKIGGDDNRAIIVIFVTAGAVSPTRHGTEVSARD